MMVCGGSGGRRGKDLQLGGLEASCVLHARAN